MWFHSPLSFCNFSHLGCGNVIKYIITSLSYEKTHQRMSRINCTGLGEREKASRKGMTFCNESLWLYAKQNCVDFLLQSKLIWKILCTVLCYSGCQHFQTALQLSLPTQWWWCNLKIKSIKYWTQSAIHVDTQGVHKRKRLVHWMLNFFFELKVEYFFPWSWSGLQTA